MLVRDLFDLIPTRELSFLLEKRMTPYRLVCNGVRYGRSDGEMELDSEYYTCVLEVTSETMNLLKSLRQLYSSCSRQIEKDSLKSFHVQWYALELKCSAADWYARAVTDDTGIVGDWVRSDHEVPEEVDQDAGVETVRLRDDGIYFVSSFNHDGEYESERLSWEQVDLIIDGNPRFDKPVYSNYDSELDGWLDSWGVLGDDGSSPQEDARHDARPDSGVNP